MDGEFVRTPKFAGQNPQTRPYFRQTQNAVIWAELALASFAFSCLILAVLNQNWGFVPWMLMYTVGYGGVAAMSLRHTMIYIVQ